MVTVTGAVVGTVTGDIVGVGTSTGDEVGAPDGKLLRGGRVEVGPLVDPLPLLGLLVDPLPPLPLLGLLVEPLPLFFELFFDDFFDPFEELIVTFSYVVTFSYDGPSR